MTAASTTLTTSSEFSRSASARQCDFTESPIGHATYGNNPAIDSVLSNTKLPRGEISINGKVIVNGRMLWATGDTVKVLFKDAEGDVAAEADTFESTSADLLTFQCPDGLASDTKYSVVVERTDPNGVMRASAPKTVTARS